MGDQHRKAMIGAGNLHNAPRRRLHRRLINRAGMVAKVKRRKGAAKVVGDNAAPKYTAPAITCCQTPANLAVGVKFADSDRATLTGQSVKNFTLKRRVIFSDHETAESFAHLGFDRLKVSRDISLTCAAHRQLGLKLGIMRLKSELHRSVGSKINDISEHGIGPRFANAIGMKPLELVDAGLSGHRLKPGDELVIEHPK